MNFEVFETKETRQTRAPARLEMKWSGGRVWARGDKGGGGFWWWEAEHDKANREKDVKFFASELGGTGLLKGRAPHHPTKPRKSRSEHKK